MHNRYFIEARYGVEFTLKFMLKQRSFSWCSALVTERLHFESHHQVRSYTNSFFSSSFYTFYACVFLYGIFHFWLKFFYCTAINRKTAREFVEIETTVNSRPSSRQNERHNKDITCIAFNYLLCSPFGVTNDLKWR